MLNINDKLIREVMPVIGGDAFTTLCAISSHMDKNKTCFPSKHRLSELTKFGREKLAKSIKTLKTHDLIFTTQEKKGGKFSKTVYTIKTNYLNYFGGEQTENRDTENRDTENRDTENRSTGNRDTVNTPLSINHKEVLINKEVLKNISESSSGKMFFANVFNNDLKNKEDDNLTITEMVKYFKKHPKVNLSKSQLLKSCKNLVEKRGFPVNEKGVLKWFDLEFKESERKKVTPKKEIESAELMECENLFRNGLGYKELNTFKGFKRALNSKEKRWINAELQKGMTVKNFRWMLQHTKHIEQNDFLVWNILKEVSNQFQYQYQKPVQPQKEYDYEETPLLVENENGSILVENYDFQNGSILIENFNENNSYLTIENHGKKSKAIAPALMQAVLGNSKWNQSSAKSHAV